MAWSSDSSSQINLPIAVLIWLMIYPMMLKIDFASILGVRKRPGGILVTLFVNWLVKPFSMALLGWLFFKHLFLPWIGPALADQYVAGMIILAAAPCTAMVFVWSYLTDGDPAYTLVQVSLNDLIMLLLFAPIVSLLVTGASGADGAVPGAALQRRGVHRDSARAREPEPRRAAAHEGTRSGSRACSCRSSTPSRRSRCSRRWS